MKISQGSQRPPAHWISGPAAFTVAEGIVDGTILGMNVLGPPVPHLGSGAVLHGLAAVAAASTARDSASLDPQATVRWNARIWTEVIKGAGCAVAAMGSPSAGLCITGAGYLGDVITGQFA